MDIITSSMGLYDRAKAKVLAEAGRFLQNRDRILRMRDIADAIQRKAERAGQSEIADLAGKAMAQVDKLYGAQLQLEARVQAAAGDFSAPGAGRSVVDLAEMVAGAAPLLKDIAVHVGRLKVAQQAIDALKSRTLTAAEVAAINRPSTALLTGGGIAVLALGGAAVYLLFFRRRRR